MAAVRARWLSRRAVSLHAAAIVVVSGCAVAAWWQVNRAQDGNQLSFLYSVMWPVFGVLAVWFWWLLVHTDYDTVGLKGMRQNQLAAQAVLSEVPVTVGGAEEDTELAAYNARLARLAASGPKTWRSHDDVVVRRTR